MRAVIYLLSCELFGEPRSLPQFPHLPQIRGFGMSDDLCYAIPLAEKCSYVNTFYDREPFLDILEPHPELHGTYDFILSSDVFEHIAIPVERAFEECFRLLKPDGFLVTTVPSSLEEDTVEHYPDLLHYAVVNLGGRHVLINRRADDKFVLHENLAFHGGPGATLEMRLFSRKDLDRKMRASGFSCLSFLDQNSPENGICIDYPWAHPFVARKNPRAAIQLTDVLLSSPLVESEGTCNAILEPAMSEMKQDLTAADAAYAARIQSEKTFFEDNTEVHDLPEIFHYWSNRWLRPKTEAFGLSNPTELFEKCFAEHCSRDPKVQEFVSIGAGNCDFEIELSKRLHANGYSNFFLDCLELNPAMIERGRSAAAAAGVAGNLRFIEADFNRWQPERAYNVVMANQSLHHVINLEGLFTAIHSALAPGGHFVTSDIIGRNGHMRWPEALNIVHEFWKELPPSYRYNQLLKRQEEVYENWDCSAEGFEGIRAQDILPLLLKHFHFELFIGFSNVILPFIDRNFGHNFNAEAKWDRDFIDRVHLRDEQEMADGNIKPTQMWAILGTDTAVPTRFAPPLNPRLAVRWPNRWTDDSPSQDLPSIDAATAARLEELEKSNSAAAVSTQQLEAQLKLTSEDLRAARERMGLAAASKWLRLGRSLGLGPKLD